MMLMCVARMHTQSGDHMFVMRGFGIDKVGVSLTHMHMNITMKELDIIIILTPRSHVKDVCAILMHALGSSFICPKVNMTCDR